jgi:hypothetical protein
MNKKINMILVILLIGIIGLIAVEAQPTSSFNRIYNFWKGNINGDIHNANNGSVVIRNDLKIDNNLIVNDTINASELCLGGNCQIVWPSSIWNDDGNGNINYSTGAVGVGGVDGSTSLGNIDSSLYVEGILEIANTGSSSTGQYGQITADSNSLNLRWKNTGTPLTISGSQGSVGVGGVDGSPSWAFDSNLYVEGILEISDSSSPGSRYGQITADSNSLNLRYQNNGAPVTINNDGAIQIQGHGTTCNSANAGSMKYNPNDDHFYGCKSTGNWVRLDN